MLFLRSIFNTGRAHFGQLIFPVCHILIFPVDFSAYLQRQPTWFSYGRAIKSKRGLVKAAFSETMNIFRKFLFSF